jgi:phage tail-like protein
MATSASNAATYPFIAFNFSVEIKRDGESATLAYAAFSECDGLEISMEVKTIREGGNNRRQIRLPGPLAYGQLTLKRGMTSNFDLWKWVNDSVDDPTLRADVAVVMLAQDGETEQARFVLTRCLPLKLKAPALNAKDGVVAIEEFQLAYESLSLKPPKT